MTNYMGINRLKKIIHNYFVNVIGAPKNFEKKSLYSAYRKFRGTEWLNCEYGGYTVKVCADGEKGKSVTIEKYKYDESTEEDVYNDRIITFYDNDFQPLPNATWFSSSVAGIKARKEGGYFFEDGSNEVEANKYVCFDIAKKQRRIAVH